jgi:voltage-gated potassium channel
MEKIRLRIFQVIQHDKKYKSSIVFEFFIITLILFNIVLIILETFPGMSDTAKRSFHYVEIFSIIIFTIEYLLRLWTADYLFPDISSARARKKYIFSFMAVIDLFAILPFYIPFILPIDLRVLRMIRFLRLIRLLKVNRYTNALITLGNVLKRKYTQLLSSILVMLILMIMASILMYNIEHETQPEVFENALSGLWWAVATLTTVWYGDFYPVTVFGKILGAVIALLGIGLVAIPTGIISAGFVSQNAIEQKEKHFCPYCGENID